MTITMDTLAGLAAEEKVVTTGAAGQRVWTADGNGNLIDVAGAPVPLDYFKSHVAASTIIPYREGMEDNPMPRPGTTVARGGSFFVVLGPKPDQPDFIQLGYLDSGRITRLYEYEWSVESVNIGVVKQPESEDWGAYAGHLTERHRIAMLALTRALGRGFVRDDAKARLREFADKFADEDFWQFLQAYDLVPTVKRTVDVTIGGRASVSDDAFGTEFEAGGTATWKRAISESFKVVPEAGCICDRVNPEEFIEKYKPASATTARVESTHCGEGCTH